MLFVEIGNRSDKLVSIIFSLIKGKFTLYSYRSISRVYSKYKLRTC